MRESEVRNLKDAFSYITDCNLATVEWLCLLKRPLKSELKRQMSIAQLSIDWMNDFSIDPKSTRAEEIIFEGISVKEWVNELRKTHYKEK